MIIGKKSIYRAKGQIEKQTENLKELFGLIKKRPDLPIVAMVESPLQQRFLQNVGILLVSTMIIGLRSILSLLNKFQRPALGYIL